MTPLHATHQSTASYVLQRLRAPFRATRRIFGGLVQDVRRKVAGHTPNESFQPSSVPSQGDDAKPTIVPPHDQPALRKFSEEDRTRIPPAIARFLNANTQAKARSTSGQKQLRKLETYVAYCAHTEPASDTNTLLGQLTQAENLARSALFPEQRSSSEAYTTLRTGINPLLDQELKEISAAHAFAQSLVTAGVGASQLDGCCLSDLMDLCRAGKTATEVVASADSIATQALNLREEMESKTSATSQPEVSPQRPTVPPMWAQNMGRPFDAFAQANAEGLHAISANSTCGKVCHALRKYSQRLEEYGYGSANDFRSQGAAEIARLKVLQDQLSGPNSASELRSALADAIETEISTWNRMGDLLNTLTNRYPDTDVSQVSTSEWLTIGRARLPKESVKKGGERQGHIDVDQLKELIDARSGFAPGLPLEHFMAMKMRYIPVTVATVPDMALSAAIAQLALGEVGSGACGTVWKATVTDPSGQAATTWALKAEDSKFDPPDSAMAIGVRGYSRQHQSGPNFTGRTVAASKVSERLGMAAAPKSRPVVFFDPKTKETVYGAASQFVQGSMLQSSPGKTARYTPDATTATALASLDSTVRDAVVVRTAQAMGFDSAKIDEGTGDWLLQPNEHQPYLQPLNWDDPELRRSAANGAQWAAITAQADNHPGNYMVQTLNNGHSRLVSIDNDLSLGKKPMHPMAVAGEVNNTASSDAWERYLKDTTGTVARPTTITDEQRKEFIAKGVKGLRSDKKFKIDADYSANFRQIGKFTQLVSDLQVQLGGTPAIGTEPDHWVRSTNMSGDGYTKASGVSRVMSRSASDELLTLTEAELKADLAALESDEQAAAWPRTQALQQMVRAKEIQVLEDDDTAWNGDEVRDQMGLNPQTLQDIAKADMAPGVKGTPNGDKHRMAYGLAAALALEEAMAREAFKMRMNDQDAGDKPVALFDPELLNRTLLEEAAKLQTSSPAQV